MSPAAARAAGASGFISKDLEASEVARAVQAVGRGQTLFPPKTSQPAPLLSAREREVLALVVSGLPNKQIGGELGISEITVKAHRGKMMQKMKADSLPNLVKMASRLRVASPPRH